MSTFHPAASSLANFNDTILMISTTRLFIYISCSQNKNQCLSWLRYTQSHSQVMAWLSGSFYLPSTLIICCHVHVLPKRRRGLGCGLSLLNAYWVISSHFLAVLEISISMCAYRNNQESKTNCSWYKVCRGTICRCAWLHNARVTVCRSLYVWFL